MRREMDICPKLQRLRALSLTTTDQEVLTHLQCCNESQVPKLCSRPTMVTYSTSIMVRSSEVLGSKVGSASNSSLTL